MRRQLLLLLLLLLPASAVVPRAPWRVPTASGIVLVIQALQQRSDICINPCSSCRLGSAAAAAAAPALVQVLHKRSPGCCLCMLQRLLLLPPV
jgi:hypothetical protein